MLKRIINVQKVYQTEKSNKLEKKTVCVIGASGGIGADIAYALYNAGAIVLPVCRNKDHFGKNNKTEYIIDPIIFDLKEKEHMKELFAQMVGRLGTLPDAIINSAGYISHSDKMHDFESVTEEEWDDVFKTNYTGAVALTEVYYSLLNEKRGTLIHITSTDGFTPSFMPYGLSKKCLNTYIQQWNRKKDRVNVYGVAPGPIATEMMDPNRKYHYLRMDHVDRRCGMPQDISNLVLGILSGMVHINTGSIIVCNGGKSI